MNSKGRWVRYGCILGGIHLILQGCVGSPRNVSQDNIPTQNDSIVVSQDVDGSLQIAVNEGGTVSGGGGEPGATINFNGLLGSSTEGATVDGNSNLGGNSNVDENSNLEGNGNTAPLPTVNDNPETPPVILPVDIVNATLSGFVDSSRLNLQGTPVVRLFEGNVSIEEIRAQQMSPLAISPVSRVLNACNYFYQFSGLNGGKYTLVYTSESDDGLLLPDYSEVLNVEVNQVSVIQNIAALRTFRVGEGQDFPSLASVRGLLQSGDVIEIDAGVYTDQEFVWDIEGLTLRGVGGLAHMRSTKFIDNGKATWVIAGNQQRIENIEFSDAKVFDENGAGLRLEANNTNICNCYFHDNENGILGGGDNIMIRNSLFTRNGVGEFGRTHNIYISAGRSVTLLFNEIFSPRKDGHNIKSRADSTLIFYNKIYDDDQSESSRAIDISVGGEVLLIGNVIHQGQTSENQQLIGYGLEGIAKDNNGLYATYNTFVNVRDPGEFFFIEGLKRSQTYLANNLYVGYGTRFNIGVNNVAGYDDRDADTLYNLPALNFRINRINGFVDENLTTDVSAVNGFDLQAYFEFDGYGQASNRVTDGTPEPGAYEFSLEKLP